MNIALKSCITLLFFGLALFAAEDVKAPVPVEEEPLHHVLMKNDSVMVIRLNLPVGERTLYHTHSHDRIAVVLSNNSITQQKWQEVEGSASTGKPGDFSVLAVDGPYTHRVHNVGSTTFEVLDVEILRRPETPSPALAAPVAGETPSARVYKWVVAPGAASAMHTHVRPYLIVAATDFNLKMTGPDGQSFTHTLKAGDFHWVDDKVTHALGNAGETEGQMVEIEMK
jgi:quercetin dioxygenase-like cupin family protein